MTPEKRAAVILAAIAGSEGIWVVFTAFHARSRFVQYLGFASPSPVSAWVAAAIVVAAFVGASVRLPSVRENLFRLTGLKLLGLAVAVAAGLLEEVMFRKWIMDAVQHRGGSAALQVAASAAAFGLAHGVWGAMGRSIRAALGATIATGILGGALAIVYLVAARNLAPCVVAHFAINALIEPGLVLAATRGEMNRR